MPVIPYLFFFSALAYGQQLPGAALAEEYWKNGGAYLFALLQDAPPAQINEAISRWKVRSRSDCSDRVSRARGQRTEETLPRFAPASGARPTELDMIDHAQALSQAQQDEFLYAHRLHVREMELVDEALSATLAELQSATSPVAKLALELAARQACEKKFALQAAAMNTNSALTKKSGLDRDYAYRAFLREYRRNQ